MLCQIIKRKQDVLQGRGLTASVMIPLGCTISTSGDSSKTAFVMKDD